MEFSGWSSEDVSDNCGLLMPHRLRTAALVTVFDIFEHKSEKLAAIILTKYNAPFTLPEFHGRGVKRSLIIISTFIPVKSHVLQDFNTVASLRHFCVHNNALIR